MSPRHLSTGEGLQLTHEPQSYCTPESLGLIWKQSRAHLTQVWGSFRKVWGSPMSPHQTNTTRPVITKPPTNSKSRLENATN